MTYCLNVFSPETYTASDRTVSGFRIRQEKKKEADQTGRPLGFTKAIELETSRWTGKVSEDDRTFLEELSLNHVEGGEEYEINESHWQCHTTHSVCRAEGLVSVTVPAEVRFRKHDI